MRDYPREARRYELLTILSPDVPEDEIDNQIDRISGYLTDAGGTIEDTRRDSPWGRRRLSYAIRHSGHDVRDGLYTLFHVELPPSRVDDVERELKLNPNLMRYLLTHYHPQPIDPRAIEEAEIAAEDAAAAAYASAQAEAARIAAGGRGGQSSGRGAPAAPPAPDAATAGKSPSSPDAAPVAAATDSTVPTAHSAVITDAADLTVNAGLLTIAPVEVETDVTPVETEATPFAASDPTPTVEDQTTTATAPEAASSSANEADSASDVNASDTSADKPLPNAPGTAPGNVEEAPDAVGGPVDSTTEEA